MNFEQKKSDLLSSLNCIRSLAEEAGLSAVCTKIDSEVRKLTEEHFHLVVLGQFKRGKTTLINAILGEPVLPMAVVPLTSVLTLIRYGQDKSVEVIFEGNRRLRIIVSELEEYVTERGNPENHKHVQYVEIQYPSEFLQGGIVLIDTPGIGSLFLHNTATTYNFIPNIDAAIIVLSADLPMTQTEYQFLEDVRKHVDKMFFVLNKIDMLSPAELDEAIEYNLRVIRSQIGENDIMLFPLCARVALLERHQNHPGISLLSRLTELETGLRSFLENEKGAVLLQATQQRALNRIFELRFVLELELKADEMPLQDLQQKIELFKEKLVSIQNDRDRFAYLLNGELTSLERWMKEEIEQFKRVETDRLKNHLSEWIEQQERIAGRALLDESQKKLTEMLILDFDAWRRTFEATFIAKYENIAVEFVGEINGIVDALRHISGKLFDVKIEPLSDIEPLIWKKTFAYNVQDGVLFLEIDSLKLTAGVLPKRVFRKKVQKKTIEEVGERVEQNAGRLLYEYTYSLQESARKFRADIDMAVEHIIQSIEHVLQQAVQRKQEGERDLQSQIDLVRGRLTKLKMIEQEFTTTL